MTRSWIVAAAALLLAAPSVQAGVGKGDFEAGVDISLTSSETEDESGATTKNDNGSVSVSGGWFFSDMIEAKLAMSMNISSSDGEKSTSGTINPGVDFLFGPGMEFDRANGEKAYLVPFAGVAYAKAIGDFDDTDFLDLHGGMKFFFQERASIEGKLTFLSPTDSAYDAWTTLHFGFNVYF